MGSYNTAVKRRQERRINMLNFTLKLQTVAEKTASDLFAVCTLT